MKQQETPERQDDQLTVSQWLAARKEAGLRIDPVTAEVDWGFGDVLDPYGVRPDVGGGCVGRIYFARSPASDIWVCFYDLPGATLDELRDRIEKGLTRFLEHDIF